MKYNPQKHHRRSIRLKGYDYSKTGMYFITICCHNRKHFFGHIENGIMCLNDFGTIACNEWMQLEIRYPHVELDEMIIMPNHIHGIIVIKESEESVGIVGSVESVGAGLAPALDEGQQQTDEGQQQIEGQSLEDIGQPLSDRQPQELPQRGLPRRRPTIGDMVGAYKSLVANDCLKIFKEKWMERAGASPAPTATTIPMMGKLWQRDYYEHIIRNEESYQRIAAYIANNTANWKNDKFFGGK